MAILTTGANKSNLCPSEKGDSTAKKSPLKLCKRFWRILSVQNLSWSCLSECAGPGEFVVTAGWGVTGFQKGLSPTLMMLQVINFSIWNVLKLLTALVLTKWPVVMSQLNITSVEELFIYTGVFTMGKVWKRNSTTIITIITVLKITDPCYGDSGGPLAIWRAGHWQLVGVLEVFLYFFLRVCICIVGADWSTILKGRGIQFLFSLSLFSDFS